MWARESAFEKLDVPRWLNKRESDIKEKNLTPMKIALRNGEISNVIDVKNGGLSATRRKEGIF
jgi:hypothetical protein